MILLLPAAKDLSQPPDFCRQATLCFPVCVCVSMLSSVWGSPEVGGEDNCLGPYTTTTNNDNNSNNNGNNND